MTHTPGPWTINDKTAHTAVNAVDRHVAMINFYNCKEAPMTEEEHQANVHLIAASPNLLEACERMFRSLGAFLDYVRPDDTHHYYEPKEALELGRSAIRKARKL